VISGDLFDEAESRRIATESYDRCFHPAGTMFQIARSRRAATGPRRSAATRRADAGDPRPQDSLISLSGGEATAAAVPGADLLVFGRMGHDMPRRYWPQMADAIFNIAARGEG
jgi:hypothetical protein